MENAQPAMPNGNENDSGDIAFYRTALQALTASRVPFLVGGAYALNRYTTVARDTKDLDIFLRRADIGHASAALRHSGYDTELVFPHWLAKVHCNDTYIDLIFSSGNGIAVVDDAWFEHAAAADVLGVPTQICPAEEMIWSKAFIMERERYDGADIAHLLAACGDRLDWQRLFRRFDPHWRVLLSHLVLFGFVYPAQRNQVPAAIMEELIARLRHEIHAPPPQHSVCLGTLLSREQYLSDIEQQGWQDGRIAPLGNMTAEDTEAWTRAIPEERRAH